MPSVQDALPVVVAVLVPVVTAVAGSFGLMFQDRRTRRSSVGRSDEAAKRVAFVDQWWKTREAIGYSDQERDEAVARARVWLEEASALFNSREEPGGVTIHRLLLLEPFQRRTAKILRAGYYGFLFLMLLFAMGASGAALDPQNDNAASDALWSYLSAILFGVIALSLRFFAVVAQTTQPQPETSPAAGHEPH